MEFRVYHATGADGATWSALIKRLPESKRDIHFLPEYGLIYQATYGQEPLLAFYGDDRNFIVQPFVRRQLNDLPFLRDQGITEPYYDIANPYGYGGPICLDETAPDAPDLLSGFMRAFLGHCREREYATEFASLHPLLRNHELAGRSELMQVRREKEIVYIDLTLSEEDLWCQLSRGNKSNIQKARKGGVRIVKAAPDAASLEAFNSIYYATMTRHAAAGRWFFPKDYFANCVKFLGAGRCSIFFAMAGEAIGAAYFLIHDFGTAYYHFGGSDARHSTSRPSNVLMYETALWAKAAGYNCYHLGGGVGASEDDSLMRYKASFSDKRATLYSYHRVLNEAAYRRLCDLKHAHERAGGGVSRSEYFPLYRR